MAVQLTGLIEWLPGWIMAGSQNALFPVFPENENISFQGSSYKGPFQKLTSTNYIHFTDEIKNGLFPKNHFLVMVTDQSHFFAEKQNGPYGPQEPFLQYGFDQLGQKKGVMEEN